MTDKQADKTTQSRRDLLKIGSGVVLGGSLYHISNTVSGPTLQRASAEEVTGTWTGARDSLEIEGEDGDLTDLYFTETTVDLEWEGLRDNQNNPFELQLHAKDDTSTHTPGDEQDSFELTETLEPATDTVNSVDWSPNNEYLALGSRDGNVYIIETIGWTQEVTINNSELSVESVSWSPNGDYLAFGSQDENVYVVETTEWNLEERIEYSTDRIWDVSWSPNGNYLSSGSTDGNAYVVETTEWNLETTIENATEPVRSLSFSPNGEYLAVGSADNNAYVIETTGWTHEVTIEDATNDVQAVSFSPNGEYLAVGSADNNSYVIETAGWTHEVTIEDATNNINSINWTSSSDHLAIGSSDDNVYIIETGTWVLEATIESATNWVSSVSFSPNGDHLAFGSADENVYVMAVPQTSFFTTLPVALPDQTGQKTVTEVDTWSPAFNASLLKSGEIDAANFSTNDTDTPEDTVVTTWFEIHPDEPDSPIDTPVISDTHTFTVTVEMLSDVAGDGSYDADGE